MFKKFVKCLHRDGNPVYLNFDNIFALRRVKNEDGEGCYTLVYTADGIAPIRLAESETPEVVLKRADVRIDNH